MRPSWGYTRVTKRNQNPKINKIWPHLKPLRGEDSSVCFNTTPYARPLLRHPTFFWIRLTPPIRPLTSTHILTNEEKKWKLETSFPHFRPLSGHRINGYREIQTLSPNLIRLCGTRDSPNATKITKSKTLDLTWDPLEKHIRIIGQCLPAMLGH